MNFFVLKNDSRQIVCAGTKAVICDYLLSCPVYQSTTYYDMYDCELNLVKHIIVRG